MSSTGERLEEQHGAEYVVIRPESCEDKLSEDGKSIQELQAQFSTLNDAVQKLLQSLVPKVEALLTLSGENSDMHRVTPATVSPQTTSFLEAAEWGDHETLLHFLKTGSDLKQRTKSGETALHLAVMNAHEESVVQLLAHGTDLDIRGPVYRTPLHYAVKWGHLGITRRLLSCGADVNSKDWGGSTALMLAVQESHLSLVNLLLSCGASTSERDNNGNTALIIAVESRLIGIILILARKDGIDEVNIIGNSAIAHAAKAGSWDIVKFLIANKASPDKYKGDEFSPLLLASKAGQVDIVTRILQQKKALSDSELKKVLTAAAHTAVVITLEERFPGIVRGKVGKSAMLEAASSGRKQTMAALLDAGVDINFQDDNKYTALMLACLNGRTDCVTELLSRGANTSIVNTSGHTALSLAKSQYKSDIVKLLERKH